MKQAGVAEMVDEVIAKARGGARPPPPVDPNGQPGDDGGMESRLRAVENAVVRIDATLPTLATKEDLAREIGGLGSVMHKAFSDQTWKFVGWTTTAGIALTAAVYFIARNVQ
jgi:hypothetical protein